MIKEISPEGDKVKTGRQSSFEVILSNTSEQIVKNIHSPWVSNFIELLLRKLGIKSKNRLEKLVEQTGIWGSLTIEKNNVPRIGYEVGYGLPKMSIRNLSSFRLFCEIHGFLPIPTGVKIQLAPNRWMEFNLEDDNVLSNTIRSLAILSDKEVDYWISAHGSSILKKLKRGISIDEDFYSLLEFNAILKDIHRLISFGYNIYAPLMGGGLTQENRFSTDLMAEKVWLDMAFVLEDELRAIFEGRLGSTFLFPATVIEDFQQKTDMRGLISFADAVSLEFPVQFSGAKLRKGEHGNWVDKISGVKHRVKKYPNNFLIINVSQMGELLSKRRKNGIDLRVKYENWRSNPFVRNNSFSNSNGGFPAFWYVIEKEAPDLAQKMKIMYLFYHLLLIFLKTNQPVSKGNFNKFKRTFARKIKSVLGITIGDYNIEISAKEENKGSFKVRIVDLKVINSSSNSYVGAIYWLEPIF